MMRRMIILPLALIALNVSGTNYYVKNGGSDSNSGRSDAQAWEHHPWMSTWTGTVTLAPGDTVFMQRGSIWSIAAPTSPFMTVKQDGSAGKPITTTWYGSSGNKPLIQITADYPYPVIQGIGRSYITIDHLEIKHFSHTYAAYTNKHGIIFGKSGSSVSHDWLITNCDIHEIPNSGIAGSGDSYNIIIGDTSAKACATSNAYSNHIYNCGYAGIGMGGCNPATLRSDWKFYYNFIEKIDYYDTIERDGYGIAISAASSSTAYPKYVTVRYNRIQDAINWHGLDNHGGSYLYYLDNTFYNCRGSINAFAADRVGSPPAICDHVYIERNTIENPGNHPRTYFYGIVVMAENDAKKCTNCYVRNNTIFYDTRPSLEGASYGIGMYSIDGGFIEGNNIYNGPLNPCSGGIYLTSSGRTTKNVIVRNNWIRNWSWGIGFRMGGIDENILIDNNIVYSQNRAIGTTWTDTYTGIIKIYNNVFLTLASASFPHVLAFYNTTLPAGSTMDIKNNIFGFPTTTASGRYILAPLKVYGTFSIDYNMYWNSTRSDPYYLTGTYTWANWNGLGNDLHSFNNTDPLFKNQTGAYSNDIDFELQSNSPAIKKGINVGVTNDYLGDTITGVPDIGAFQIQPGVYTPKYVSSVIENIAPSTLEISYNTILGNVIPANSAFTVYLNGIPDTVTAISISGIKIMLSLTDPAKFGDSVRLSYTQPAINPIESTSHNLAQSFIMEPVVNNLIDPGSPNRPPVIVVNYDSIGYSGHVYEIDASGTSDPDGNPLIFKWTVPPDLPVSSTNGSIIRFLSPVIIQPKDLEFGIMVSDGSLEGTKTLRIHILPYKPNFAMVKINKAEASDYTNSDFPSYAIDGDTTTQWSSDGDNQWLQFTLPRPYKIEYFESAFAPGQTYASTFDIYASKDNLLWEPIFIRSTSCDFSGRMQVFDFPALKTNTEYSYIKLIGHGNALNTSNHISEIKFFGTPSQDTTQSYVPVENISIFPNPAHDMINILVLEPPLKAQTLRIYSYTGELCREVVLEQGINNYQIPISLRSGAYVLQILLGSMTVYSQKLIVI